MRAFLMLWVLGSGVASASEHSVAGAQPAASTNVVYPGFEKHELPDSVSAVLDAARQCIVSGSTTMTPHTRSVAVPHLSASVIDGADVVLQERQVDIACRTKPVRRCSFTYVWADGSDQVGYTSVQCIGSFDDPYTSYLVTASIDLRKGEKPDVKGTKKDKAQVMTALSFQTDEFPGTHVSAFQVRRRRDKAMVVAPELRKFDDFASTDAEVAKPVSPGRLAALARAALEVSCLATGACGPG
ncbi:MAG: hypothetical protein AB8H79_26400 [Myxococcota bacterium]